MLCLRHLQQSEASLSHHSEPNEGFGEAEEVSSRRRLAFATLLGRDELGPGDGEGLKDCFRFPLDNEGGGTGPN